METGTFTVNVQYKIQICCSFLAVLSLLGFLCSGGIKLPKVLVPMSAQVNRLVAMQHFYKFLFSVKLSSESLYLAPIQHCLLQANKTQTCICIYRVCVIFKAENNYARCIQYT